MTTYFNHLSEIVRQNIPKYLRLKRILKGSEINEYIFQVIISDIPQKKANLTGNIVIKLNENKKEILWANMFPNANIKTSQENPKELRKTGLGTYAGGLSMLAMSTMIENIESYNIRHRTDISKERLGQLKKLGIQPLMTYNANLQIILDYATKKGFNIQGIHHQNNIYSFLIK